VNLRSNRNAARNGELLMSISDSGVDWPTEKADEIFEAFFTTKRRLRHGPDHQPVDHRITRRSLWAGATLTRGDVLFHSAERAHALKITA